MPDIYTLEERMPLWQLQQSCENWTLVDPFGSNIDMNTFGSRSETTSGHW
jgi:hypothetical protein